MDTGKKRTSKISKAKITKKDDQKPKENTDADLAFALSMAASSDQLAATGYQDPDEIAQQQYLMHLKQQEEADAEYARQLADEFAAEANQQNASESATNPEPINGGDDMDAVLEEIAKVEAQERLKATGHAYRGKTNINRILADEDEEENRIREKAKRDIELRNWREERARQDAEFLAAAEKDRLKEELSRKASETANSHIHIPTTTTLKSDEEPDIDSVPLTKEELRRARLAFFTTTNSQKF